LVHQNLSLCFFLFLVLGLVFGSRSGSAFVFRSELSILEHALLDLPTLFLLWL
jgi:hypothetical protein